WECSHDTSPISKGNLYSSLAQKRFMEGFPFPSLPKSNFGHGLFCNLLLARLSESDVSFNIKAGKQPSPKSFSSYSEPHSSSIFLNSDFPARQWLASGG
ncbi:13172_t:CDS:2, partial [Funneliformis geosporum]